MIHTVERIKERIGELKAQASEYRRELDKYDIEDENAVMMTLVLHRKYSELEFRANNEIYFLQSIL